jgi:hypothetical protein
MQRADPKLREERQCSTMRASFALALVVFPTKSRLVSARALYVVENQGARRLTASRSAGDFQARCSD